jgi:asparagine synthase (glutamine-hydrolysing)
MRAAIGAVVSCDGNPAVAREAAALAARARLPAAGAARLWAEGEAGLVWVPAWSLSGAAAGGAGGTEAGAAAGAAEAPERCAVVVDGTIDNRGELARELGLAADAGAAGGEARVIAAAYQRWGADCPERLIGEFAFLLWDRAERRLLAARDAFGLRELFYRLGDGQLQIASQLQMLDARPRLSDLDDEYAAEFLASHACCGAATPFRHLRRLPAGHRLTLRAAGGRLAIRPGWQPGEAELPRGISAAAAGELFAGRLGEAVERCLASGGRAWAELSGGLDSSAVVCLAQEVLRRDGAGDGDFATVSMVWDETPQSDERRWSGAVARRYGLRNHQVRCDDLFFDGTEEESRYRNEPHFGLLCHPMLRAEGELLRERGVEVLLTGARAEAVVLTEGVPPVHLADSLRRLRLGELGRQIVAWQGGLRVPMANLVLGYVLGPLLHRRRFVRSTSDRGRLEPWVDRRFAARMDLRARARAPRAARRFRGIAQQLHYEHLVRSEQTVHRGICEWSCEARHPFLHRPLVELALAIPWEWKLAPREGKPLLRRGLADLLPEEVRTRQGGAGPGPAVYKAFASRWGAIEPVVRSSLLAELGLVDGAVLRRTAELVRFGSAHMFGAFLSCLAFEYWLRAVTGEPAAGAAAAAAGAGMAAVAGMGAPARAVAAAGTAAAAGAERR